MRVNSWMKALVLVAGVCASGCLTYAGPQQGSSQQSQGDPVADAARKAREEKKNAPKPKKVYTDDDVKPAAPEPTPAPAAGTTGGAAATESAAGQTPVAGQGGAQEDPNSEKAWRKRFQEQHDKIAKAEKELDILQREQEKAQVQYYPDPQKAMMEQNTRSDVNALLAKIEAKKQEIAQLKQALDDMESDLRKAGGDPGWAR